MVFDSGFSSLEPERFGVYTSEEGSIPCLLSSKIPINTPACHSTYAYLSASDL